MAEIVAALERGKERGEVRPDPDSELAMRAVMRAFVFHRIAEGQPQKGWPEHVTDILWRAFTARPPLRPAPALQATPRCRRGTTHFHG